MIVPAVQSIRITAPEIAHQAYLLFYDVDEYGRLG